MNTGTACSVQHQGQTIIWQQSQYFPEICLSRAGLDVFLWDRTIPFILLGGYTIIGINIFDLNLVLFEVSYISLLEALTMVEGIRKFCQTNLISPIIAQL